MCRMITRDQAVQLFGSVKALQNALGLKTHSAIYMWGADKPIPDVHELRIRYELRPDAFDVTGDLRQPIPEPPKANHAA